MELDMKHWKPIEMCPDRYLISDSGEVYSLATNRKMKAEIDHKGYMRYSLTINKKCKHALAHRLVAMAFIPNPENKETVDHINGNKLDNRVSNLKWATLLENVRNPNTLPKVQEYGRRRVAEWKAAGKIGKGKHPEHTTRNRTAVYKDGVLIGEFSSMQMAADYIGTSLTSVWRCYIGKQKQINGFTIKRIDTKI